LFEKESFGQYLIRQVFSAKYLKELLDFLAQQKYGELATIVGRYYAMDRDKRWERIKVIWPF
jgi:bisphosphoglycerate-independent phosphoglycerate mutase (AlkP superfamily)